MMRLVEMGSPASLSKQCVCFQDSLLPTLRLSLFHRARRLLQMIKCTLSSSRTARRVHRSPTEPADIRYQRTNSAHDEKRKTDIRAYKVVAARLHDHWHLPIVDDDVAVNSAVGSL